MLGAIFSFRGRINRLQYLGAVIGLGLATFAFFFAAIAALVAGVGAPSGAATGQVWVTGVLKHPALLSTIGLAGLTFFGLSIWINLSVQARRFRDMGWEPTYVFSAWIAVIVVDRIAAVLSGVHGAVYGETIIGSLVNLALYGCLLFWPGRRFDDLVWEPEAMRPAYAPAASPAPYNPAPAMVRRPSGAPAGFGRRGL
jgi:uncharacterized membrane protein YhaH (DUF805 family)